MRATATIYLCANLEATRVTIPQRGPAAASLRFRALEVRQIVWVLYITPNFFIDYKNIPKPPHKSEDEVENKIWDNMLQKIKRIVI
jgi:hypothetical protein